MSSSPSHPPPVSRPPLRNKSSSALSTRSNSSTGTSSSTYKRNKSSTSLHTAGGAHSGHAHHNVSFVHHRKSSHGASGAGKRSGSSSGGRRPLFGLTALSDEPGTMGGGVSGGSGAAGGKDKKGSSAVDDDEDDAEEEEEAEQQVAEVGTGVFDLPTEREERQAEVEADERGRSRSRSQERNRSRSSGPGQVGESGSRRRAGSRGREKGPRELTPVVTPNRSRSRREEEPPKEERKTEQPTPATTSRPSSPPPSTQRKNRAKFEFDDGADDDEEEEEETPQPPSTQEQREEPQATQEEPVEEPAPAPAPATSPTASVSRPPMRNKSSSGLSTHSASQRPKRSKSSASIHSSHGGHGHHGVQFVHHNPRKNSMKRSGSASGRKSAFGFGMTSLESTSTTGGDGGEQQQERERRPSTSRRDSESSQATLRDDNPPPEPTTTTTATSAQTTRGKSVERKQKAGAATAVQEPTTLLHVGTPEASSMAGRKVKVGSVMSDANAGSDWESAAGDSPLVIGRRELPDVGAGGAVARSYKPEVVSGLAQALGADTTPTSEVPPETTTPTKVGGKGAATFQIDDTLNESPEEARPPPSLAHQASTPPSEPSPQRRQQSNHSKQSSVPFPSSQTSPARVYPRHPGTTGRKSSNASIISNASNRSLALSFAGRMGPPAPLFRRSASGVAPTVIDKGQVRNAELASPDSPGGPEKVPPPRNGAGVAGHRRAESLTSVRSLRTVAETTDGQPLRASTLGPNDARRMRLSGGPEGGSSSALTALGNLASAGPSRQNSNDSGFAGARRSASGYFSALRGFTAGLPGLTPPPLSPSASRQQAIPGASTQGGGKARQSASPGQFATPIISKFVEPPSTSPIASNLFALHNRTNSSASLAGTGNGGGAISRTQQKALLARDAPYYSHPSDPPPPAGTASFSSQPPTPLPLPPTSAAHPSSSSNKMTRTSSGGANPSSSSSAMTPSTPATGPPPSAGAAEARQLGIQRWAMGLVREAERIERQYRSVEKWRDPLGEGLERVLGTGKTGLREREREGSSGGTTGVSTPSGGGGRKAVMA